ncbi:Transketolase 1 [Tepidimonas charontis]|uniref:transketolase n=1 Tax=Tepidimonas charontis TaxID=2267262 RepID=A0A554XCB3_9BURK|nr:Transketolase 1 [Tepidimonas charontis]
MRAAWDARARGAQAEAEWRQRWQAYAAAYPREAAELQRRWAGELPADFADRLHALVEQMHAQAPTVATRKASQMALEALTAAVPELLGGSADLTGSNLTQTAVTPALRVDASGALARDAQGRLGRHINYGVREFGMAAMMNGIALHGGYIPYGGTFLTFSDYSRNAIRMAALMRQRVIHVLTHDSIGLGEDGPTHQPVEHAASLRLIPHLDVWRPADAAETAVAWGAALQRTDGPTALLLSRQALPALPKPDSTLAPQACGLAAVARGGYIIAEPHAAGFKARKKPKAVLLATGSEVALALQAQRLLAEEGIPVRVVSLPSTTVFDRQPLEYRLAVLPRALPRIAVEAGSPDFWWKYGCAAVVGVPGFGESAPAAPLFELFGLTPANIAATVRAVLAGA